MRMATERRRKNQRGMAIFFYATMLIFVVGCVGLAVDVGTIYMIRARLVAAVDAAAARRDRLEAHVEAMLPDWSLAPAVRALQALRGIAQVAADWGAWMASASGAQSVAP